MTAVRHSIVLHFSCSTFSPSIINQNCDQLYVPQLRGLLKVHEFFDVFIRGFVFESSDLWASEFMRIEFFMTRAVSVCLSLSYFVGGLFNGVA